MQNIRIVEFPPCRMVSSGKGMFGEEKFTRFHEWMSRQPQTAVYPENYLCGDGSGVCWLYRYRDGMEVPQEFEIIPFSGGFYAVATDIDQQTDTAAMNREVNAFLEENGWERDPSRSEMGHVLTSPAAQAVMGYSQMDYYTPIKAKGLTEAPASDR